MIKSLLLSLIRSRRVALAVIGNGLMSVTSLALSVSIARTSSVEVFSAFSLAMVAYLFSTGLIAAAFTNTALSRPGDEETLIRSCQRSSFISLLIAISLIIWGTFSGNSYILYLGFSIHGLILLNFNRVYDSAAGHASRSTILTTAWSLLSISVSASSFLLPGDSLVFFLTWAFIGAICGYISAFVSKRNFLPLWRSHPSDTRNSSVFTADYLVGAGGAQLTTGLLGFLSDTKILGGVRAAGTLLGPVNLISTTARSLMLPYLARGQRNPKHQFHSAIALVIVQVSITAPILILLQFIPEKVGTGILGDSWHLASVALLPMSIDALFNVIMAPAIAAHRVAFAGKRTLSLRILIGVPRPFLVLFCAYYWGITGAAWSMASIAIIGSILWWVSYSTLQQKKED